MPGEKILIVDDEEDIREVLADRLEAMGYETATAADGVQGLEAIQREAPDLVFLDIRMPELDGFGVLERLQEEGSNQVVVVITAHGSIEVAVKAMGLGAHDFVEKPFDPARLEVVLDKALAQAVLRREHAAFQEGLRQRTEELEAANAELREANRQILEAARRKSQFLSSMSHELRTPLNAIIGFTGLVLRRTVETLPPLQRENLEKVKLSGEHLLTLINDLLDLSKIEAGRMEVPPQRSNVREQIAACCATIEPMLKPGVNVTCDVSDSTGEAHTDPDRLRQILLNLLSNAAKFTEAGEITVSATKQPQDNGDETLVIAVSDTGSGIPPDALDTIFEEFRQVEGNRPGPLHHQTAGRTPGRRHLGRERSGERLNVYGAGAGNV